MTVTGEIRWDEGPLSLENQGSTTALRYVLTSDDPTVDDRGTAALWLADNAPTSLYGLDWNKSTIIEQITDNPGGVNPYRMWDAVVEYVQPEAKRPKPLKVDKNKDPTEKQETKFEVRSAGGRSMRRLYSRECVEETEVGATGDWLFGIQKGDPGRLLNLKSNSEENNVSMFTGQGIDVPIGKVEIVVNTVRLNEDVQVNGYIVKASEYAAKNVINELPYYGFPKNTLKLVNFTSTQRGGDEGSTDLNTEPWDVSYTFEYAASIPVADVDYPSEFNSPADQLLLTAQGGILYGWQYMDTLYITDEQTNLSGSAKFVMPKAIRVSVHDIFEEIDFAAELKI